MRPTKHSQVLPQVINCNHSKNFFGPNNTRRIYDICQSAQKYVPDHEEDVTTAYHDDNIFISTQMCNGVVSSNKCLDISIDILKGMFEKVNE